MPPVILVPGITHMPRLRVCRITEQDIAEACVYVTGITDRCIAPCVRNACIDHRQR